MLETYEMNLKKKVLIKYLLIYLVVQNEELI